MIRDRMVFGIADNNVRERLLRVPDLTLNKALETALSRAFLPNKPSAKEL